jgi:integrase
MKMTIARLNTELIFTAKPKRKQYFIWDDALKGFGIKITPSGLRFFLISILRGGVRHTEIIGDVTQMPLREARALAKTRIRALSSLYVNVDADTPFEIIAEQVLARMARLWKPRTQRVNRDYLRSCILPYFTGFAIGSINGVDVEAWFATLASRPAAANRSAPILSVIMREAEEMGARRSEDGNPVLGLRRYRKHKRQRIPTADEMARLGEALEERRESHPVLVVLLIMIILTGCRKSELIDLCWRDYRDGHLYLSDSKTGPKTVFLCSHARAELDALKTKRSKKVFPSLTKGGGRICIDKFWRDLRKEIGMEDVRLHDFRHHYASVAVRGGENIHIVGILLGHNQTETTLRYVDLDDKMMRDAKKLISKGINSKKGDNDES